MRVTSNLAFASHTPARFTTVTITVRVHTVSVEEGVAESVYCRTGHTTVGPYYPSFLRKYLRILYGCSHTARYNLLLCRYLPSSCLLYPCTYCASYRILTHPHCLTYSAPVITVIPGVIDSPHFMARARIPSATALRELPKACLELWRALFPSLSKYGAPRSSELLAPQPCHPLPYGSTYSIH